ncbi:MAG: M20 family metallopeptidase [Candidatus Jordarchaeum sp.]|uniref:M20 family metallopeptidase n=1 Tax=Candidatus Jordarchaeum sp. TaxID=2823881 RepID=UPI004049C8A8
MSTDTVLKEVNSRRDDVIKLVQELIRYKTVNPPGDTSDCADFIKDYLSERGLKVKLYESEKGKVSAVGILKGDGDRRFIWDGHIDVVPIAKPDAWTVDPWEGQIVESRIVGRGAADMKGNVGAAMVAASILAEKDINLGGDLVLAFVPDEETGGYLGTGYLVDKGVLDGDACIVGEFSPFNTLCVGEKGILWLNVKASGIPAHASVKFLGVNAIDMLYKFFEDLYQIEEVDRKLPAEFNKIIEVVQPTLKQLESIGFPRELLNNMYSRLSVNVGIVKGGEKVNIVPANAEAEIDIRILPGMDYDLVKKEIDQIRKDYNNKLWEKYPNLKAVGIEGITIDETLRFDPSYQKLDAPLVPLMKRVIQKVTGKEPLLFVHTGGTDARFFRAKGIQSICYGAGSETPHGTNEYVPIEGLIEATKVYALAAMDFLATT